MLKAFQENNADVSWAAQQAGISRKTHYEWMRNDEAYRSKFKAYRIKSLQDTIKSISVRDRIPLQRKKVNGYVYLVHCKGTTYYKIGISKLNYHLRLSGIQSGCPFELEMIYVIHSNDHRNLEKELHDKFKDKRVRGEWFDLDEASLNTVMKYLQDTHQPQMQIDFE